MPLLLFCIPAQHGLAPLCAVDPLTHNRPCVEQGTSETVITDIFRSHLMFLSLVDGIKAG
jgi:hypothetical protein